MLHIFDSCSEHHTRREGEQCQLYSDMELGRLIYKPGDEPRIIAKDYRTLLDLDETVTSRGGENDLRNIALPGPVTQIDVLRPNSRNNVIMQVYGTIADELRPRLMDMPYVYREVAQCYGKKTHTLVFTMTPDEATGLILAMYCEKKLHTT